MIISINQGVTRMPAWRMAQPVDFSLLDGAASISKYVAKAKEYNLLLVPGSAFACPGYVRLSYCVSYEMIKKSLPAFERLMENYK